LTELLTPDQAAARLRVCTKTLRQLRQQGLIRHVAVSKRKIFYRPEDCDAYLESCVTVAVPQEPTRLRGPGRRLRVEQNVVSFTARRNERLAARGR
jgi:hypothetical protein